MTEIRMWKWEFTDHSGRRAVSRWLMTEREALRYRDAIRLQHTFAVVYDGACPIRAPGTARRMRRTGEVEGDGASTR